MKLHAKLTAKAVETLFESKEDSIPSNVTQVYSRDSTFGHLTEFNRVFQDSGTGEFWKIRATFTKGDTWVDYKPGADQVYPRLTREWRSEKPFEGWTDYPFKELGDTPHQEAPVRKVVILTYDQNKYCNILVDGVASNIKRGYIFHDWKLEKVVDHDEACVLPRSLD